MVKSRTFYLGIDPGMTGGLAVVSGSGVMLDYTATPTTELDMLQWLSLHIEAKVALIEQVASRPSQSAQSGFTFGKVYGEVRMAVIATSIHADSKISLQDITPKVWQKEFKIRPKKKSETQYRFKDRIRQKAQHLFPKLALWEENKGIQMSICDAILIAEYARRKKL